MMRDIYRKKFDVGEQRISAAGSCFAQHIGRELRESGFRFNDLEPAPQFLPRRFWVDYGYGLYSARYGNIYSSRQLLQLLKRSTNQFGTISDHIWTSGAGYVDAFRPTIEPVPAESPEEIIESRRWHLRSVLELFERTDVFIFTLGLTESWMSIGDGAIFPVCPGTAGGKFDASQHAFVNQSYTDVLSDLEEFFFRARDINSNMKFILTVSPVPLMATATDQHVVPATSYSKSVLRAVAGFLSNKYEWVDYFPSFEIISSTPMRSCFYNSDMRTVAAVGVEHVMKTFFESHPVPNRPLVESKPPERSADEIKCDEELLAAFGE
jgi:hypothetical protein